MRILVASHTYILKLNCEKFRILASLAPDLEVTVVVPRRWRPGGVQRQIIESQPWAMGNFRVVTLSHFSQNNQGMLTFGADLISLMREFRPQILQVEQGAKSLAYAQTIALNQMLGLKAKNVLFTWWNLPYRLRPPVSWLEAYNLHHTHGLMAGNQDGADILQQHGYTGDTVVMPQLGVDETLFRPRPQPDLAHTLGIHANAFVVGFVGRFVEEKGLLTLCRALGQLGNRPWQCLMVGRGPLKEQLTHEAYQLGIGDRLIWVESVPHDEIPRYINLMNVLVLPSETTYRFKTLTAVGWKEQFGHVLIEAMACRVPVIGSDSGEIPHVIQDAGLVFPEGDAAALGDRLTMLMNQPSQAEALASRGYKRAMTEYTNLALAKKCLSFYERLIAVPD
ncbi:MAG: hormogonium polysaccharide biosynthesis glycosyltransferase HpsO [Elainellaceae cyanobacterium]